MESKKVWIFAESTSSIAELCAGGHLLGGSVTAIVPEPELNSEVAIKAGADKVYLLRGSDTTMLEDYMQPILDLLKQEKPSVLLMNNTKRAKLIAGRLAANLNTSVLTDVMQITAGLEVKRMVYGGAAIRSEHSNSEIVIALVGEAIFEALPERSAGEGSVEIINPLNNVLVNRIEIKKKQGETINLGLAKRVVAVGRGIANQDDLKIINDFADAFGAEVGCSRPIAEGVNWLPRERYIGVSGAMLKPDIYVGVGVSGQVQHMVGVYNAKTIIAINKDKNAPIFKQADYGIVGDLYNIIPKLAEKIKLSK